MNPRARLEASCPYDIERAAAGSRVGVGVRRHSRRQRRRLEELGAEVDAGQAPIDSRAETSPGAQGAATAAAAPARLPHRLAAPADLDRVRHRRRPHHAVQPAQRVLHPQPTADASTHPMGTDELGRDVLSRVMAGARDVLIAAPIAAFVSVVCRHPARPVMGYYRGWVDEVLGRIVEALLSIPVVLMALSSSWPPSDRHGPSSSVTVAVLFTPIVDPHRACRGARRGPARLRHVGPAAR